MALHDYTSRVRHLIGVRELESIKSLSIAASLPRGGPHVDPLNPPGTGTIHRKYGQPGC